MFKPTDIFCHTIFFAKFNMLAGFNLHFVENIDRAHRRT